MSRLRARGIGAVLVEFRRQRKVLGYEVHTQSAAAKADASQPCTAAAAIIGAAATSTATTASAGAAAVIADVWGVCALWMRGVDLQKDTSGRAAMVYGTPVARLNSIHYCTEGAHAKAVTV